MRTEADIPFGQLLGYGLIPGGLIDTILFVDMNVADALLAAEFGQYSRRVVPVGCRANQQRDIQLLELVSQCLEVAQLEVDLGGGVIMCAPLAGAEQKQRQGGALLHRREQGGVVMHTEVVTKPDQLHCVIPEKLYITDERVRM